LATNEPAVTSRQRNVSWYSSDQGIFFFYQDQHDCRSPSTRLFSVSAIEDETEEQL
jgi:hypothetical protein